jgi:hypothetical protein
MELTAPRGMVVFEIGCVAACSPFGEHRRRSSSGCSADQPMAEERQEGASVSWQDDHRRRVDAMPTEIREAHEHSIRHRDEVLQSATCGCFYCGATFAAQVIDRWTDEVEGIGQTALCPRCGIDSVIGDRSGYPVTEAFLSRMKAFWFHE